MTQSPSRPPQLFDRPRIAARLARAWTGSPDFVSALVAEDLADRLAPIKRRFEKALIMGPDARTLPAHSRTADAPVRFTRVATMVDAGTAPLCDPEALELPGTDYDLIVSLLDLQTVNDVPGFLSRLHHHLRPDGLMIAAAIGGRTLSQLRSAWIEADAAHHGGASARIAPFMDVRDAGGLLQRAGLALPVADTESLTIRYADPLALMRELKALGAANPMLERPPRPVTRAHLASVLAAYPADADGRISASLEIVWLSGWAPHESQQQPLAPGSAQISLGCVLGDKS